jgi:hypothetical protein
MKTAISIVVALVAALYGAYLHSDHHDQHRLGCSIFVMFGNKFVDEGRALSTPQMKQTVAEVSGELTSIQTVSKWSGPQIAEARRLAALYTGHQPER